MRGAVALTAAGIASAVYQAASEAVTAGCARC